MLAYIKSSAHDDGRERRNYHCAQCGAFITQSGALVSMNGSREHSYVNPAGIRCNFMTFLASENTVALEDLYMEHSWFPGYGWRFLICESCLQHLGWQYEAVQEVDSPRIFFGVLTHSVKSVTASEYGGAD